MCTLSQRILTDPLGLEYRRGRSCREEKLEVIESPMCRRTREEHVLGK